MRRSAESSLFVCVCGVCACVLVAADAPPAPAGLCRCCSVCFHRVPSRAQHTHVDKLVRGVTVAENGAAADATAAAAEPAGAHAHEQGAYQ